MLRAQTIDASAMLVLLCRMAIGIAGMFWWYEGDGLQLGVAIGALALTVLPGLLVYDPPLKAAGTAVTAVLLAAHIVFGMLGALYETSL